MPPTVIFNPEEIDFRLPGKHHYQIAFHLDSAWGYSLVPMTVINGTATVDPGKTPGVAAFGGTHGNEYEGQIAIKRLCGDLDPKEMTGCVVLVPQLSETACQAHTRSSPEDGVNMNRAFPGGPRGTLSYRISHFVTRHIFPLVGVVIDIHAGGHEAVFPLCTSFHPLPDRDQFARTAAAARLFDTPFIYIYTRAMASGLLTDQAEDEGKISIGGEFGNAASVSPKGTLHAYEGIKNVLRHFGQLSGEVRRIDPGRKEHPRMIAAPHLSDYIPCPVDGIWEPLVQPGADVREGDLIGRLHDLADHTSTPSPVVAHKSGTIAALYFAARVRKGLTLFVIAEDYRETEFP